MFPQAQPFYFGQFLQQPFGYKKPVNNCTNPVQYKNVNPFQYNTQPSVQYNTQPVQYNTQPVQYNTQPPVQYNTQPPVQNATQPPVQNVFNSHASPVFTSRPAPTVQNYFTPRIQTKASPVMSFRQVPVQWQPTQTMPNLDIFKNVFSPLPDANKMSPNNVFTQGLPITNWGLVNKAKPQEQIMQQNIHFSPPLDVIPEGSFRLVDAKSPGVDSPPRPSPHKSDVTAMLQETVITINEVVDDEEEEKELFHGFDWTQVQPSTYDAFRFIMSVQRYKNDPARLEQEAHLPPKGVNTPLPTLCLDLDDTLTVMSTDEVLYKAECRRLSCVKNKVELAPMTVYNQADVSDFAYIHFRPYARRFLEAASKEFEIIVFTAAQKPYADQILNYLDPGNKFISHRLYRDSCQECWPEQGNPEHKIFVKDLRILGRDLATTMLLDNSLYCFAFQLNNGVLVEPFKTDVVGKVRRAESSGRVEPKDCELRDVLNEITDVLSYEDYRKPLSEWYHLDLILNDFVAHNKHLVLSQGLEWENPLVEEDELEEEEYDLSDCDSFSDYENDEDEFEDENDEDEFEDENDEDYYSDNEETEIPEIASNLVQKRKMQFEHGGVGQAMGGDPYGYPYFGA